MIYHCGCGHTFAVEEPDDSIPPDSVVCPECGITLQPEEMCGLELTAKGVALNAAADGLAARAGIEIPDPPPDWLPGDGAYLAENVLEMYRVALRAIEANEGLVDDWCLWCGNHGVRLRSPEAAKQIVKMLKLDDPDTNDRAL